MLGPYLVTPDDHAGVVAVHVQDDSVRVRLAKNPDQTAGQATLQH